MSVAVRTLTAADAETYYALRLRSVRDHPEAFLASFEEERDRGLAYHRERLAATEDRDDDFVFAAFDRGDEAPVGMTGVCRLIRDRAKGRHRALLWGVYVAPEARGRGVGRALVETAVRTIAKADGIELVQLGVGTENPAARALYASVGFRTYGVEERAMRLGRDRAVDEELMVLFL